VRQAYVCTRDEGMLLSEPPSCPRRLSGQTTLSGSVKSRSVVSVKRKVRRDCVSAIGKANVELIHL